MMMMMMMITTKSVIIVIYLSVCKAAYFNVAQGPLVVQVPGPFCRHYLRMCRLPEMMDRPVTSLPCTGQYKRMNSADINATKRSQTQKANVREAKESKHLREQRHWVGATTTTTTTTNNKNRNNKDTAHRTCCAYLDIHHNFQILRTGVWILMLVYFTLSLPFYSNHNLTSELCVFCHCDDMKRILPKIYLQI
jgi:hypothetical protein